MTNIIRILLCCWPMIFNLALPNFSVSASNQENGCRNLTGTWRNQLNSTMKLAHDENTFTGSYSTGVESKPGAARGPIRPLYGRTGSVFTPSTGVLVTWLVHWRNGSSATTWNGQCYQDCASGETVISTIGILRSLSENCTDDWSANRVGQDIFHRV